jgi:hypothetical protein
MKRHNLNTAYGLLSLVGTVSLLSGTFSSAWADVACTNASFSGSYAFSEQGTVVLAPNSPSVPMVAVGILNADGEGKATVTATGSFNGVIAPFVVTSGSYTINPDCSGTMEMNPITTLPDGSKVQSKVSLAVIIAGPEVRYLSTTSGETLIGTMIKQTSPCKWCRWW